MLDADAADARVRASVAAHGFARAPRPIGADADDGDVDAGNVLELSPHGSWEMARRAVRGHRYLNFEAGRSRDDVARIRIPSVDHPQ